MFPGLWVMIANFPKTFNNEEFKALPKKKKTRTFFTDLKQACTEIIKIVCQDICHLDSHHAYTAFTHSSVRKQLTMKNMGNYTVALERETLWATSYT